MKLINATNDTAIYKSNGKASANFDSVSAFLNYAGNKTYDSIFERSNDWTLNANGKDMHNMIDALNMPSDIMNKLDAELELDGIDALETEQDALQVTFSEDGFMCDTTAFYAGEENCMLNVDMGKQKSKTIYLASDIISSGSVSAEKMVLRGIALIRAIKTLQKHGFNVGLVAYINGNNDNIKAFVSIAVKRPEEALNESLIAAVFAHPSFFRTLGHNAVARLNNTDSGSMGRLPAPTKNAFKYSFINTNDLYVLKACFSYSDCFTEQKAEQWIINEVDRIVNAKMANDVLQEHAAY